MVTNDTTPVSRATSKPIDIDAILAKRQEVTGHANKFPFIALGKEWMCMAPDLGSDDFKAELADLNIQVEDGTISEHDATVEMAHLWLGEEQADDFLDLTAAAGVSSSWILQQAISNYSDQVSANPTRPSSSINRRQRRQR